MITVWKVLKKEMPPKSGRYIVWAKSQAPNTPFCSVAWWEDGKFSLVPEAWVEFISHWTEVPPDLTLWDDM